MSRLPLLEEALDAISAAPPSDFVSIRKQWAKRLRDEGHPEEAKQIAARRKPTAIAHAVNRLAREHRELIRALLDSETTLRAAQGSGQGEALRTAMGRERDALNAAGEATGLEPNHVAKARSTLRAAAQGTDADREVLERGWLESELEAADPFALAFEIAPATVARKETAPARSANRDEAADRKAEQEKLARERAEQERIRQEHARLQHVARTALAHAETLRARANAAARSAEEARREAEEAEARAMAARRALEELEAATHSH